MSKKKIIILRCILGVAILIMVLPIVVLTSCDTVNETKKQETITDEPTLESKIESDSETEDIPKSVIFDTKKVESVINEFYRIPDEKHDHYLLKLEGSDELYKFYSDDPTFLEIGMQVSIEYLNSGEGSIKLITKLEKT